MEPDEVLELVVLRFLAAAEAPPLWEDLKLLSESLPVSCWSCRRERFSNLVARAGSWALKRKKNIFIIN